MKLSADNDLVKDYKKELELEEHRELPVMSLASWLHGFQYWSVYHEKDLVREDLDWNNK